MRTHFLDMFFFIDRGMDENCKFCKEPCTELKYEIAISSTQFPANNLAGYYQHMLNATNLTTIRDNFLLLNVYVESKELDEILEQQEFTMQMLIAETGGTIGFWLGMSVLSVVELLQMLLYCAWPKAWMESPAGLGAFSARSRRRHMYR